MFELATPWILIALPLPWLIWFFMPQVTLQVPVALKVPFFHAMQKIVSGEGRKITNITKISLWFIIWSLLLFALAGPRWVGQPRSLAREGYNIMLALDISLSMDVRDMAYNGQAVTRLAVVKRTAKQFIRERVNDKIGLILFGERAYLLTPLTYDHQSVEMRLDDATAGLAGRATSIGDALGLAVKRLQNVPAQGRMIILLTDGVNNAGVLAPLKAAQLAKADGIKVYTIGLGASVNPQSFDAMFLSMNGGTADLDEKTLKTIASMTGGRYFRATDMQSLQNIYQLINQMATVSQDAVTVRPQHEYYPWPLGLALLLFLYGLAVRGGLFSGFSFLNQREASK